MTRNLTSRTVRLAIALAVALGTVITVTMINISAANALGAGRVCFFDAPNAASFQGHVGWAFSEPGHGDSWYYGATDDDANGDPYVPAGSYNGAYISHAIAFSQVTSWFKANSIGYTSYRCMNTPTSAVGAAMQAGQAASGWGYTLIGNNCLDHAYRILTAYRGDAAPIPGSEQWLVTPNQYFWSLGSYGYEAVTAL
jgi:hypothetical protein